MIHLGKTVWDQSTRNLNVEVSLAGDALRNLNKELNLVMDGQQDVTAEEFLAASLSSCYTTTLKKELESLGYIAQQLATEAEVYVDDKNAKIKRIELCTEAMIPGITFAAYLQIAEKAMQKSPIAHALEAIEVLLHPTLKMGILSEINI